MSFQIDWNDEKIRTRKLFHVRFLFDSVLLFFYIDSAWIFLPLWWTSDSLCWQLERYSTNALILISTSTSWESVLKATGMITAKRMTWNHVSSLLSQLTSKLNCNRFKITLRERLIYEVDNLHISHKLTRKKKKKKE